MADLLSLQQIAELREAFSIFDKDSDGSITPDDVMEVFKLFGQHVPAEKVRHMIREGDLDPDANLDFLEFLNLVVRYLYGDHHVELEMTRSFQLFDLSGRGFITASNLQLVMGQLGCVMTVEETDNMMREADIDGDGVLNFDEFRRMMLANGMQSLLDRHDGR